MLTITLLLAANRSAVSILLIVMLLYINKKIYASMVSTALLFVKTWPGEHQADLAAPGSPAIELAIGYSLFSSAFRLANGLWVATCCCCAVVAP